jgi:chemotaxis signal transduction protein
VSGGVLVFVAGGARLGVPLGDVGRLILEGRVAPVPFGHPALAGLMRADDGALVPVFDLRGLGAAEPPATNVVGATVAIVATPRGAVGLRLERLLGTASAYAAAVDDGRRDALSADLRRAVGGTGRPVDASAAVGDEPFFFFSAEAFLAAVGL